MSDHPTQPDPDAELEWLKDRLSDQAIETGKAQAFAPADGGPALLFVPDVRALEDAANGTEPPADEWELIERRRSTEGREVDVYATRHPMAGPVPA